MQFKDFTREEIRECFNGINKYLSKKEQVFIRYIDLGCKVVRLIGYSEEFLPHIEKQLTFGLRDNAKSYDATLVLWKETDFDKLVPSISPKFSPKTNMRLRIEMLYSKKKYIDWLQVIDKNFSKIKPLIDIQALRGFFTANDYETNTYYYGVKNLEPEEFIKEGHLFVQFFNNILKTPTSNLVHGAVIGLNNNGICFCARGQRGKSTLSVLSMMKGFEYVSDDYLILHQNDKNELLSSPIYSIITLAPVMYNRLYDYMKGSQFVSNNARKDKYVFNISNYHNTFKMNYPIKLCIFPEIVSSKEPSIKPCSLDEKGRAIVQLIQSTLMQTQDLSENWTVRKMMNMVKNLPFYKLNLCWDIDRNTEFLRDFMNKFDKSNHEIIGLDKIAIDITFDLANILNTETGIIYSMNKFATNVFENLKRGVSQENVRESLKLYIDKNDNILRDFDLFVEALNAKGITLPESIINTKAEINEEFAEENNYKLSFVEHAEEEYRELVKEKLENKENENELCIK